MNDVYRWQEERNSAIRDAIQAKFPEGWEVSRRIIWGPDGYVELKITSPGGHEYWNVEDALADLPLHEEADAYRREERRAARNG